METGATTATAAAAAAGAVAGAARVFGLLMAAAACVAERPCELAEPLFLRVRVDRSERGREWTLVGSLPCGSDPSHDDATSATKRRRATRISLCRRLERRTIVRGHRSTPLESHSVDSTRSCRYVCNPSMMLTEGREGQKRRPRGERRARWPSPAAPRHRACASSQCRFAVVSLSSPQKPANLLRSVNVTAAD